MSGDKAEALLTIGGTGDNGMVDGAGDVAKFHGVKAVAWDVGTQTLIASDFFNYRLRALSPPKHAQLMLNVTIQPKHRMLDAEHTEVHAELQCELQYKCHLVSSFSIETAERMENCLWKMMIFY